MSRSNSFGNRGGNQVLKAAQFQGGEHLSDLISIGSDVTRHKPVRMFQGRSFQRGRRFQHAAKVEFGDCKSSEFWMGLWTNQNAAQDQPNDLRKVRSSRPAHRKRESLTQKKKSPLPPWTSGRSVENARRVFLSHFPDGRAIG